jgi:pimeloyl-ACP methyl ester carboxylesterase
MERFVEGLRIETRGRGERVLFVHADFVDGGMWSTVMDALAGEYAVACFDKRGYGASAPAEGPVCRRRELEGVLRSLGPEPVHLVGCSNGGQASLDLAMEQPGLVRSLTLVNATPSGFQLEGAPPQGLLEMLAAFERGDQETASELQLRLWFDGPRRDPGQLDPRRRAARAEAGRMNRRFVARGTYAIADAAPLDPLEPPALGRLAEVRLPVLVVAGALDHPEVLRAAQVLAEGIPGARSVSMEGCAHVPPLEAPEAFAATLRGFLRG